MRDGSVFLPAPPQKDCFFPHFTPDLEALRPPHEPSAHLPDSGFDLFDGGPRHFRPAADSAELGVDEGVRLAIARLQQLDVAQAPEMLRAMSEAISRLDGKAAAAQWVRQLVTEHPTLNGLEVLLSLSRSGNRTGATTVEDLDEDALAASLRKLTQRMSHYGCRICGFRGQQYYWQCPGCGSWDSYQSRSSEESVS